MKILQLESIGNGGRTGNELFTIASTIGIALRNGYIPRFPDTWEHKDKFNLPFEWFGPLIKAGQHIVEKDYGYTDFVLAADIVNIKGYLQSPRYWQGYEQLIRNYLTPLNAKPGSIEGVAIHYRRGDYIGNPNYVNLQLNYYVNAYDTYFKGHPITAFSDDLAFIKLHHPGHWHHEKDAIKELAAMCEYNRHIIANSSFSWWAAYISRGEAVAPAEWFCGALGQQCTTEHLIPDYWHKAVIDKPDLNDVTFIIPVSYDHADRKQNLAIVRSWLKSTFNTNVLIGEIDTDELNGDYQFKYGKFHRTKALNELTKAATTPYVINWDADVLASPWAIYDMVARLRNGVDMVYPYDGHFAQVPRTELPHMRLDLGNLASKDFKQMMHFTPLPVIGVCGSVGGAVGFNKERYLGIGGENENFVSWAPEDVERYWRANLFGLTIERTMGTLYHIEHHRTDNSNGRSEDSMQSHKYWEWLQQRSKDEVAEHLKLTRGYAGGWKLEDAIKEHAFSLELAYYIGKLIEKFDCVYDLGCGPGFYAQFLRERGMCVWAIDSGDNEDISIFTDIDKQDILTFNSGERQVVLCLEVGEHVPKENESQLLDVICRHATDMIILSWAIPGQQGFGHVNNQPNDYIIKQMKERGWRIDIEQSNHLRKHCSGATWFENTIMVFNK